MKINCEKETERIIKFIKDTFNKANKKKAIIGISGGLDSAVVASLLTRALGKENVYGYMLPCGTQPDIKDSELVCKILKINSTVIDIHRIVESFRCISKYILFDKKRIGNISARSRMIILYDMSAKHNGLVVGTGNKTELLLGYFTLYGDGACALEPLGHLYKTQVKQLAKYLKIPDKIINKPPSAGLWEGQTDEKELGMTYYEIDKILYRINKNSFKLQQPKELK